MTVLADPGVTLAVPADGRLNGYRFAGQVLGVAVGRSLPSARLVAAAGQRLWVFGLRWEPDVILGETDSVAQVTAALVYEGRRTSIPITRPPASAAASTSSAPTSVDSGPEYFSASLPATAPDVVLELSSGGYTQDFSLTHMAREGPQPAALYRNETGWQTVNDVALEQNLPTPYDDGTEALPDAQLTVQVPTVTLSYFGPDGTDDPAPSSDQAWLVPDIEEVANPAGPYLEYRTNVTASDIALTIAGQPPVHPKVLPGGPDPVQAETNGATDGKSELFPYIYAFAVPADTTAATLSIHFPPELAAAAYSGSPGVTVQPPPATFQLTLPDPSDTPLASDSSTAPAAIPNVAPPAVVSRADRPALGRGSGLPTALIAIALIALLAAAALGVVLRRRRLTATAAAGGMDAPPAPAVPSDERAFATVETSPAPPHPGQTSDAPIPPVDEPASRLTDSIFDEQTARAAFAEPGRQVPEPDRTPVLTRLPASTPPTLEGGVWVLVLGPIELVGWSGPSGGPGQTVLELLTFLALYPEKRYTAAQLRDVLGRGRTRDIDVASVRRYMGEIRRVLGDRVPEARRGGGYQLGEW